MSETIQLFKHQKQFLEAPFKYPEIKYHFLIAGYGAGKSSSLIFSILNLIKRYHAHPVTVLILGPTQTLLRKTLMKDLLVMLEKSHSTYSYNKVDGVLTVGSMVFVMIAADDPAKLFAYNAGVIVFDEGDELNAETFLEAFRSAQERNRVTLPDGREPFTICATTAQGMRGVWQLTQTLRETKQAFTLTRGLTKDNTSLSKEYVDSLYALYNEQERKAYLEGYFVALNAGRVYPGYDASICQVAPIEVQPMETVMIGQDFNLGASCAVAMVKRDKILYIVKEFAFADFGQAPKILRESFPANRIIMYPDASGKMIIQGYLTELRSFNIEIRMGEVNPSIPERIFLVNKLFLQGRLKLSKACKQVDIALNIRSFDPKGDPEKSKTHPAPDDYMDSLEYNVWRTLSSDSDFFDLFSTTRTFKNTN